MISLAAFDSTMASSRKIDKYSVESAIYLIRGQRVMLDSDLAAIYGVSSRQLNQQLKRNKSRFPEDFAFQLNQGEFDNLKSQIATSNLMSQSVTSKKRGGRRLDSHDEAIVDLFAALKRLLEPEAKPKREIGFHVREAAARYRIRRR